LPDSCLAGVIGPVKFFKPVVNQHRELRYRSR
jgi:hypothetical protein